MGNLHKASLDDQKSLTVSEFESEFLSYILLSLTITTKRPHIFNKN